MVYLCENISIQTDSAHSFLACSLTVGGMRKKIIWRTGNASTKLYKGSKKANQESAILSLVHWPVQFLGRKVKELHT